MRGLVGAVAFRYVDAMAGRMVSVVRRHPGKTALVCCALTVFALYGVVAFCKSLMGRAQMDPLENSCPSEDLSEDLAAFIRIFHDWDLINKQDGSAKITWTKMSECMTVKQFAEKFAGKLAEIGDELQVQGAKDLGETIGSEPGPEDGAPSNGNTTYLFQDLSAHEVAFVEMFRAWKGIGDCQDALAEIQWMKITAGITVKSFLEELYRKLVQESTEPSSGTVEGVFFSEPS